MYWQNNFSRLIIALMMLRKVNHVRSDLMGSTATNLNMSISRDCRIQPATSPPDILHVGCTPEAGLNGTNVTSYRDVHTDYKFGVQSNGFDNRSSVVSFDSGVISKEIYTLIKRYLFLFIFPVIILCGNVGNLLSLYFLTRLPTRDSVIIYLCALAIADTVVLICCFMEWLPVAFTETDEHTANIIEAHIFIPVKVFLRLAAVNTSSYLTIIISIERVLAVTRPLRMKRYVLVRFPKAIAGIAVFSVTSFFLPNIWRYEINVTIDPKINQTVYSVGRSEVARKGEFFNTYGLIGQILFTLLPTCIVIICTVSIIVILSRQNRLRLKMTNQQDVDVNKEMRRITWMLVTVATMFVISSLPICVIGIISKISIDIKLFGKEHYLASLIYDVGHLLTAVNSSLNFLIYVAFSSRFREDFLAFLFCRTTFAVKKLSPPSSRC